MPGDCTSIRATPRNSAITNKIQSAIDSFCHAEAVIPVEKDMAQMLLVAGSDTARQASRLRGISCWSSVPRRPDNRRTRQFRSRISNSADRPCAFLQNNGRCQQHI
jgi:hypothetical protein